MTTTDNGVAFDDTVDLDGADAFLSQFMPQGDPDAPKKKPSEEGNLPKSDDTPDPQSDDEPSEETPEDEPEGEDEEPEAKEPKKVYVDDDEAYAKVKQGDTEHEVPLKDLKRLWGQEAALTRKSQEVAELRKATETENRKYAEGLNVLLQRAKAKLEPYSKIDFMVAAKELSPEDFRALREEAVARNEDVKFLEQELNGHMQQAVQAAHAQRVESAKACIAALNDKDHVNHIPDWSDNVYNELRTFSSKQGLDVNLFNQLTDPAAMKLIHMAMMFERGQNKVKVLTTKTDKQPKKIIKSTKSMAPSKGGNDKASKAMAKLRRDGSTDDAAEAFLAKWNSADSD